MPAVPKHRKSSSKARAKRANDFLTFKSLSRDAKTGSVKMPHRVDPETGEYKGRKVMEVK